MRISDWSSDVCSSDLTGAPSPSPRAGRPRKEPTMDFSRFFIDRPIFAAVLSIVIFAAGLISIPLLPIGEYPNVVPPSVVVRTVYPGAAFPHQQIGRTHV